MAWTLDATGLTVKTRAELIAEFTADMEAIYGTDINLESDTPDGQLMNIWVQSVLDLQDLLVSIYSGMDPDNAIGNTLDQRVAINGIERRAGTYTVTNITLVNSAAVSLIGLNDIVTDESEAYTVSDNEGNRWYLANSINIATPGTQVLVFRSAVPGAVLTIPNTINVPVTIVLGVTSVNNPTTYTTLGINEETDAALKIRRQQSVALPSQGYVEGLTAALLNLESVTYAAVFENVTSVDDGDGIPAHGIWVIVAGTATDEEIANVIYVERSLGCAMKGTETYNILRPAGDYFTVRWDPVVAQNLYIEFDATSIDGVSAIDTTAIKNGLVANYVPGVYEEVDITSLGTAVQAIDPNVLVTNAGFSLSGAGPWTDTLTPTTKNRQFAVLAANIAITVV
mgnify:CR=1 FL=1